MMDIARKYSNLVTPFMLPQIFLNFNKPNFNIFFCLNLFFKGGIPMQQQPNLTLGRTKSKFNRGGNARLRPMTENPQQSKLVGQSEEDHEKSFFAKLARQCTCSFCCTDKCLVGAIDKDTKEVKKVQDWREKVTICIIFGSIMAFVAFFTVGLQEVLCPADSSNLNSLPAAKLSNYRSVFGYGFLVSQNQDLFSQIDGGSSPDDISRSQFFSHQSLVDAIVPNACDGLSSASASFNNKCDKQCFGFNSLKPVGAAKSNSLPESTTAYNSIAGNGKPQFVLNGNLVDFTEYLKGDTDANDPVDAAIKKYTSGAKQGLDATLEFDSNPALAAYTRCLSVRFRVQAIQKEGPGCFIAQLINIVALISILGIIFSRFFMAIYFSCFMEPRLIAKNDTTTPPIVVLVTCYNEETEGLKGTFESLANTTYDPSRKLLFVVVDGINIKGKSAPAPTSQLCIDLIKVDEKFKDPLPMDYFSIESGEKQHNRAQIYIGHYHSDQGSVMPVVVCVKCGTEKEAWEIQKDNTKKPNARAGNRGKRDSQIILMKFWSHCFYDDRMPPLEIDMYNKIHYLTGIFAEEFEYNLMVDADTVVESDSLDKLIGAMKNDALIMGMCGETRIVNKSASWVTKIQVFEYYISHHMAKSFESAFGGVTCLPGCFCLYRIKAPKINGDKLSWIPILAHRDISEQYSKTDVHTLHERNLLLLGEDRFLTTLMLRNFPKRRQIFVPSARCYTEAPTTFNVLIDQRRRWINSTLHNLFELIFVNQLCGVMCCSMQFVVALEVFGTISLPMAIILTYVLIIKYIVEIFTKPPQPITYYYPLIMFLIVLFLPGVLVMITRREVEYLFWMMYYLTIGLPIWNFVLPLYAYVIIN
eukprot:NODE_328_length_10919_cov_0.472828.p1 type:complete len:867 gc:universal NODE_328_length_10919_cov_0.472828:2766-5366(+)